MEIVCSSLVGFGGLAASGGAGGDGDDPSRKSLPKSHAVDAPPALEDGEGTDQAGEIEKAAEGQPRSRRQLIPSSFRRRQLPSLRFRHPSHYLHQCNECLVRFKAIEELRGHKHANHGGPHPALLRGEGAGKGKALAKLIYQCNDCPRSFSTKQGLGGHRARCHSKKEARLKQKQLMPSPSLISSSQKADVGSTSSVIPSGSTANAEAAASAGVGGPAIAQLEIHQATEGGGEEYGGRRVLMFDLNLPPPPEEEDAADGGEESAVERKNSAPGI